MTITDLLILPSIRSIAWNPQGSLIATGAADKTLRVCECNSLTIDAVPLLELTRPQREPRKA